MSEKGERDEEMSAGAYEAETELAAERAAEGLAHLDAGEEDDASGLAQSPFNRLAAAYRVACAESPDDPAVHYHFGRQYFQVGLYEEAAAALLRAAELNPRLAEAHYFLGSTLREQGRLDDAIAAYGRALEIDPELFEARLEKELAEKGRGERRAP
jgi:tetratricopeptide (TPR) repeat protein